MPQKYLIYLKIRQATTNFSLFTLHFSLLFHIFAPKSKLKGYEAQKSHAWRHQPAGHRRLSESSKTVNCQLSTVNTRQPLYAALGTHPRWRALCVRRPRSAWQVSCLCLWFPRRPDHRILRSRPSGMVGLCRQSEQLALRRHHPRGRQESRWPALRLRWHGRCALCTRRHFSHRQGWQQDLLPLPQRPDGFPQWSDSQELAA